MMSLCMNKRHKKNYSKLRSLLLFLLIFSLISIEPLFADKRKKDAAEVGIIKVTAQKQEEEFIDVPVSISVLGSYELEDSNIENVWDITDHIPNLMNFDVSMTSLFSQPTMRGLSAPAASFQTTVGMYVDGIPLLASPGFAADLLDVERVEVLRGPQGTLYGKNTEAGAISIITKRPGNEVEGKVMLQAGEDKRGVAAATVSGPIMKDKLFFGFSGKFDRKDGFIENTFKDDQADDRQKAFGRAKILWTPTDRLDLSLIASRISSNEHGASSNGSDSWYDFLKYTYNLDKNPDRKVASGYESKSRTDNDLQAFRINYAINNNLNFTSITSRTFTDWNGRADYDYHPEDYIKAYQNSIYWRVSQEFRLDWKSDRLKYLIGFYGDRNRIDYYDDWSQFMPGMGNYLQVRDWETTGNSYSVFGHFDYSLTDELGLILGLRYEKQFLDYDDISGTTADEDWDEVSPKFALKYKFSPNFSSYLSAAKGYRTGGFNAMGMKEYSGYDPEKLWSYEAGLKTEFFDKRLKINASVYYMDIEDMQVQEAVVKTTQGFLMYFTNAAEATAKGGELEASFRLCKDLTLNAGLGISDITFETFKDLQGDYSGNRNPFAPEYTFNLGALYRNDKGIFLKADVISYGDVYIDKENKNKKDGYEIVNMKIGYEMESFDIYIYGDNIFDKEYDTKNYGGMLDIYSDPREVGVQAVYRF